MRSGFGLQDAKLRAAFERDEYVVAREFDTLFRKTFDPISREQVTR